jgi:hypothetical protein
LSPVTLKKIIHLINFKKIKSKMNRTMKWSGDTFGELANLLLGGGINGGEGLAGDAGHELVVDEQSGREGNRLSVQGDGLHITP